MARKPRRMSAARKSRKRWLAVAGIVVFLLVDIVLVVLALQSTSSRDNGAAADVPDAVSTPGSTASSTPTPESSEPTSVLPVAPTRILAALDATTAWRATTGACPDTAATPEISDDGGATWTPTDITSATGLSALQRIVVSDASTATFLGHDEDCAPDAARTFVAGSDFAPSPNELAAEWYLAPVGGTTIHTPNGEVTAPCARALTLAPIDDAQVAVLCADGDVHLAVDGGAAWTPLDAPAGTIAITGADDGFLTAGVGVEGCDGVQVAALGVDGETSVLACVESSMSPADLAGTTAIDWTDDAIWMWVDDRLLVSTDEGETWG
jgi:hypothetical protein